MSGRNISDFARDALLKTAAWMLKQKKEKHKLISDDCDGFVETEFKSASIGSISGVIFSADVSTPNGQSKTKFILRDSDLDGIENAKWYKVLLKKEKAKKKFDDDSYKWN